MSDSVQPHRRQPTRLHCPWDSPGKNTGVGCHFLLQCIKVKSESEVSQSCPTLATPWTAAYQAPPSMGFARQEYWSGVPLPSPTELWGKLKQNHYGIEKNKSTWQSWSWNMEILVFSCKVTLFWPRDPAWGRVQVPINSCFPGSQEVPLMVRLIRLVITSFFTNSKETILYWVSLWSCISQ